MASMLLAAAACTNYGSDSSGCSTDQECRGDRICVEGGCVFPPDEVPADGGESEDPLSDSGVTDGGSRKPSDTVEDDSEIVVDSGPVEPSDIWESDPDTNTDPPPPPPEDGGIIIPEPDADVGTPDSGGQGPPMSCHEFATCQFLECERFDYSCKQEYSARTSDGQLQELDSRQNCMRDNCSGTTGQERRECRIDNCEMEWNQCVEDPNNAANTSDCSEFHGCLQLCAGSDNPQSCRADCQQQASGQAARELQAYQQCVSNNCQGTEGQQRLECIRNNCSAEMAGCWGC
jgi:hypothetical protein